jgi:hypothetical protein
MGSGQRPSRDELSEQRQCLQFIVSSNLCHRREMLVVLLRDYLPYNFCIREVGDLLVTGWTLRVGDGF